MSFDNPWVLNFLLAVAVWGVWEWKRTNRKLAIALKAFAFAFVIAALADPKLHFLETKISVTVLIDTSSSIPEDQIEQQRTILHRLERIRDHNQLRVFSFDESVRSGSIARDDSSTHTNLEEALRVALSSVPMGLVPKIVLISDGLENQGAVERAVNPSRQRGVPISTIALEGRSFPGLRLKSVTAPTQVFRSERFSVDVVVESPSMEIVDVLLSTEGKEIGKNRIRLVPGENFLRFNVQLDIVGAALVRGRIQSENLGDVNFYHTLLLSQPRVLLVSSDEMERDIHLVSVLQAAGFEIERSQSVFPPALDNFHVIIANNTHLEGLAAKDKERIEKFIYGGGGFLQIAGDNSLYLERLKNGEDPLRRALPADLAPPRTPEGAAVVLILDKSSSMEGQKMNLARQSALGVVENLRLIDQVGVLVFDNSFEWAVTLQENENPNTTKELIAGIIADGGTQIAPALAEAFRRIHDAKAAYKHILLLTDGISEEGDSIAVAKKAAKRKVTISTIGLGQDVNRTYLERIARTAEGKPHFLLDISELTQLVLKDVMEHTGSSVMERDIFPRVARPVEILNGVSLGDAGPLRGWVKFVVKPEAETILEIDTDDVDQKDPLLVRWQYGLGRAAVFTSDAKQVWATNWVAWDGFDAFWANLVRDLLPRAHPVETKTTFDSVEEEIVVRYRWADAGFGGALVQIPELYVLGPDSFRHVAKIEHVAHGAYEARIPVGAKQGLFRIRPSSDIELFPETAFYRGSAEDNQYGSNPELLRKISAWTGGQFNPSPEDVFKSGQVISETMVLWPAFLSLAVLLNILELVTRKGWIPWIRSWT
jgi:Ca-activated chloride channel family protein